MPCRSHVESGRNSPLRAADLCTVELWTLLVLWMIGADRARLEASDARSREASCGKRSREEELVVLGTATHVGKRQPFAGCAPVGDIDLLARSQPVRRLHPAWPRRGGAIRGKSQDVAHVMRHAAVAPPAPRSRSARTASESDTGGAPPESWTYATRAEPPMPAQTGTSWLC